MGGNDGGGGGKLVISGVVNELRAGRRRFGPGFGWFCTHFDPNSPFSDPFLPPLTQFCLFSTHFCPF